MAGWIGTLGDLTEFKCPSKLSRSGDREMSRFTGLDGTDTVFVGAGRTARTWDVDLSAATPADFMAFELIEHGARGLGPFRFVDPSMASTNMLTPRQSLLAPGTVPGMLTRTTSVVPGVGTMPAVMTIPSSIVRVVSGAPVVPGRPVTASVWVAAPGTVTLTAPVYDAAGATVDQNTRRVTGLTGGGWASITVTPSEGAARMEVGVMTYTAGPVACPAVTWTDQMTPWAVGQGVAAVVVEPLSVGVLRASSTQQLADVSVRIQEVRVPNA